jgi:hypothetical protein
VRHVVDLQVNGRQLREILITDALNRNVPEQTIRVGFP